MRTTQTAFLSALLGVSIVLAAQALRVPQTLPTVATTQLSRSLEAPRAHAQHVWRDILPLNDDGTVSAYVEIPRGERRKFEFDMAANVRGVIVGLMLMEDEKGHDPKVVLSLPGSDGRPQHTLTTDVRQPIESYFKRYRMHEPGKHSDVRGWSSSADGLSYVKTTHAFYRVCQADAGRPFVLDAR